METSTPKWTCCKMNREKKSLQWIPYKYHFIFHFYQPQVYVSIFWNSYWATAGGRKALLEHSTVIGARLANTVRLTTALVLKRVFVLTRLIREGRIGHDVLFPFSRVHLSPRGTRGGHRKLHLAERCHTGIHKPCTPQASPTPSVSPHVGSHPGLYLGLEPHVWLQITPSSTSQQSQRRSPFPCFLPQAPFRSSSR